MLAVAFLIMDEFSEKAKRPGTHPRGPTKNNSTKSNVSDLFTEPLEDLFAVLSDQEKVLTLFQLCVVALGLALVGQIVVALLAGSTVLGTVQSEHMTIMQIIRVASAAVVAIVFYILFTALLIYTVPLCVLKNHTVKSGLYYAFQAAVKNALPFTIFVASISAPLILSTLVLSASTFAGIIVALLLGALGLPIAIYSMFCSYKLMFDHSSQTE
jgi:hypothetical protein